MNRKWFILMLVFCITLSFGLRTAAQENTPMEYVVDTQGLLDSASRLDLERQAQTLSRRHGCGLYIVTVDDYRKYGSGSVFDVTTRIYHNPDNGFGHGSGRDGILLLLSMQDRDWALFVYGETASYAFPAYAQEQLEEAFLDDFRGDDWYGGFSDYLERCDRYLTHAAAGDPVRESPLPYVLLSVVISVLVALAVCLIQLQRMRSVHKKVEANAYAQEGIQLTARRDLFTHTTVARRKLPKNSGSSGSSRSHSGGGGSGRSGKF